MTASASLSKLMPFGALQVSSFDLVNRTSQFSFKVRRLGEFLPGTSAIRGPAATQIGSEGEELDIEDPLYGNVGGEEEQVRRGASPLHSLRTPASCP